MHPARPWCDTKLVLRAAVLTLLVLVPARAQITSLPFDLVDSSDDPQAADDCDVDFTYVEVDPTTHMDTGGASLADFDGDGLIDIFLPNNKDAPNALYRNLGDFKFQDEAAARGVDDPAHASSAALFLDYDHDGDLDLWVACHLGKSTQVLGPTPFRLFRNTGAAGGYTFVNVSTTAGFVLAPLAKQTQYGWVGGIGAGDYDHDGWTDIFATYYSIASVNDQWRLFRNTQNPTAGDPADPAYTPRTFVDATPSSGLEGSFGGNSWQPMFWDVNRDGWADLHIAMDNGFDLMFLNDKDGTFTEVASAAGLNGNPPELRTEMGTSLGDPDNDLDQDLHSTNVNSKDRFYRNDSVKTALSFTDIGKETGLHDSRFGWGTAFLDLDNDGDMDHLAVSGVEGSFADPHPNTAHLNLYPQQIAGIGVDWETITALVPDFSSSDMPVGNAAHGLAVGDLDSDGDMDVVVTRNFDQKAGVFRNTLVSANAWFEIDLVGPDGSLDTTGSRVYVMRDGQVRMREIVTGSSFISQEPPRLHFGLGPPIGMGFGSAPSASTGSQAGGFSGALAGSAAKLPGRSLAAVKPGWAVIRWPDGSAQVVMHPKVNSRVVVLRSAVDDTGDIDADGHLTATDLVLLQALIADPVAFATTYPNSPGSITGDVNDDGVLDLDDVTAWGSLPPH